MGQGLCRKRSNCASIASNKGDNKRVGRRAVLSAIAAVSVFQIEHAALAANGTWSFNASTSWGNTAAWVGGSVASGTGAIADFSQFNLTASPTVTLTLPYTIGTMLVGDTDGTNLYTFAGGRQRTR